MHFKSMLKAFVLGGFMAGAMASAAQAQTAVTIYGDDAYKPYSYAENGEVAGIYTEVLKEAFATMPEYDVTIELIPWKQAVAKIEKGQGYALFPPYHRPDLRPFINPYSENLFTETTVIYCRNDVNNSRTFNEFPKDFAGLTFLNNSGFASGGEEFMSMVEDGAIRIEEAPSTEINMKKLLRGRGDCFINDRLNIKAALNKLGDASSISEAFVISEETTHVGYSLPASSNYPFTEDFQAKLNAAIVQLRESGRVDEIIEQELAK